MKCNELMKRPVECCKMDETVASVAARMRDHDIGFMPVCDSFGRVRGTITDRDLAVRVVAGHLSPDTTIAQEVMSHGVIACTALNELEVAKELMRRHKVSRILCVDEGSHPVGVISLSDIAMVEHGGHGGEVLQSVAQREVSGAGVSV